MPRRLRFALAAPVAVAACVAAPPPTAPAGALRYAPQPSALRYVQTDTAAIEVAAGGQAFVVDVGRAAAWSLALEDAGEGVRVTARLDEFDARVENPLAGARDADESDVRGPVVFTLDPRGRAALESAPAVERGARELFSSAPVVHHLLPRLPGRSVAPGDTWADTIRYVIDEPVGELRAEVALTYTVVGDSTLSGLPHVVVRFAGSDRRTAGGETGGMAFTQEVEGPVRGFFLWDTRRGVLRSSEQRSDLSGTMAVPIASTPLAVRVRATARAELVDAPEP